MSKTILFLVGPTASGKTEVAVEIAKNIPAEIISADSMLVYKGMDIGTAKPSLKERGGIPHHLIDIAAPNETFSAFDFRNKARSILDDILARGKLPLVAGGSGLYIKALTDGLSPQPGANEEVRRGLEERVAQEGLDKLHEELSKLDPEAAAKINRADKRRIIRALEIIECSERNPSDWYLQRESLESQGYRVIMAGISRNRTDLYADIDKRVDGMFDSGLFNEVKMLFQSDLSKTARQAVGYKELLGWFEKDTKAVEMTENDLELIKTDIKNHTRQLAKRQLTWFKKDPRIHWVERPTGTPAVETAARISVLLQSR